MLHSLRRHPIPVEAHFDQCLVLTYALPADVLQKRLPPGLEVERFGNERQLGFLAIAMVQTRALRPAVFPKWAGQDFFLVGYRVFCRYQNDSCRPRRGLRILRSDTDSRLMLCVGNLLTHYNYHLAEVYLTEAAGRVEFRVQTHGHEADLHVIAYPADTDAALPPGSCFTNVKEARRFAGPLPCTFDYEPETHSIVVIQATRARWQPAPVRVQVFENSFLQHQPYATSQPVLVSAFHTRDVEYRWERGVRYALKKSAVASPFSELYHAFGHHVI